MINWFVLKKKGSLNEGRGLDIIENGLRERCSSESEL